MKRKARLSALVGLLAFFIAFPCYAIKPGLNNCSGTCIYWQISVSDYNPNYVQCNTYSGTAWPIDGTACFPATGTYTSTGCGVLQIDFIQSKWDSVNHKWVSAGTTKTRYVRKNVTDGIAAPSANISASAAYPSGPPSNCADGACDSGDTDGDGVCNSCDKIPSAPDPKDCVSLISRNAAGQVVDMDINVGCKQTTDPDYKIETYRDEAAAGADADARLYFGLYAQEREMDAKTCNASTPADADGNCACAYPSTNTTLAGFTDSSGQPAVISPDAEKEFETAQKLDDEDKLNDCAAVKNRCEAACSTRGGAVTNTCSSESGSLTSSCTCANNELAYDLDNESSNDSDNSSSDSDGDGVPNSIDPDSTGGSDSNADNVDDIAAAVKGAIASLGLGGKLDAVNGHLNSIGNSVSGLGSKIDGVGSAVSGLGSKIDSVGSSVNGLGSKLDGIGEKLDGISDKLNNGYEVTGSANLPSINEYNTNIVNPVELSFVDTVHNFLNSSLPVLSSIRGSSLTASGSPSMSKVIWGKTITIDFSDWQGVLRAAGLVLVAVATIFAFIIIL